MAGATFAQAAFEKFRQQKPAALLHHEFTWKKARKYFNLSVVLGTYANLPNGKEFGCIRIEKVYIANKNNIAATIPLNAIPWHA